MADEISFTDMGKALDDAAAQYRDTNSVDTTPDTSSHDAGGGEGASEGTPDTAPQGTEGDANLPKTDNTQVGAGDDKGTQPDGDSAPADDKQDSERKAFNHAQAAARIARKRAKEQREYYVKRQRIEAEQKDFANEQGQNYNPQMAAVKLDQIRELDIQEAQRHQNEFIEESYAIFQDEQVTQEFINDCQTYADWINTKEPQLGEYIKKPYGKLVLKGWLDKIAKQPEAADWWESLTPFEKYKTLDRYYNEFSTYIEKVQRGEIQTGAEPKVEVPPQQTQTQTTQPNPKPAPVAQNIPVPGSGRNTNNMPPTDNFSLELERAMQLNGVSRLVR